MTTLAPLTVKVIKLFLKKKKKERNEIITGKTKVGEQMRLNDRFKKK